jgi:hypothetical protein
MALFRVKWYHTEEFEADIEIPDEDLELGPDDIEEDAEGILKEKLTDVILEMDQKALTMAFGGCTEREITEVTELESKEEE